MSNNQLIKGCFSIFVFTLMSILVIRDKGLEITFQTGIIAGLILAVFVLLQGFREIPKRKKDRTLGEPMPLQHWVLSIVFIIILVGVGQLLKPLGEDIFRDFMLGVASTFPVLFTIIIFLGYWFKY
jgi:hypothetical protein